MAERDATGRTVTFRLLPGGFKNRDLRQQIAALLGTTPDHISPGRMTFDLRRLRLYGLIERVVGSQRYRVTPFGFKVALFLTRCYNRLLRPGTALLVESGPTAPSAIRSAVDRLDQTIDQLLAQAA
jgi:hypothetical protein